MVEVIWDLESDVDGNLYHVREHGLTAEEVEEILREPTNPTGVSRSSGRPITFGWTSTGKYIAVVWEIVERDPRVVYPVTAYVVPEP
jgi:hypothetical protein